MSETKIASAIALATLAGATYYVVKNWEFEGDDQDQDQDPDPQPQPQPEDERPDLIDPLTLDENDSLKAQSGKTFTVENPLYNDRTKYGKLFKNYPLKYKVIIDSSGRSADGRADLWVEFEPVPESWVARHRTSGKKPDSIMRRVASGTPWESVQKPTFQELLTAVGGVRTDGPYFGPSVLFSSIVDRRINGEVAILSIVTATGKRESRIRLNPATGEVNSGFSLATYIRCGRGSYNLVQSSSARIGGNYDEATGTWVENVPIPASAITALNNACPIETKTVSPPQEIRVWEGTMDSTGRKSYSTIYVLQSSNADIQLPLDTQRNVLLYNNFYNRTDPAAEKDATGVFIKSNFSDSSEAKTYLPHTYVKKTYECDCPSESVKSGQKVSMPMECSKYAKFAIINRYEELITACGGRPAPPTGPVLGGGGGVPAFAESGSHQSFMTEFL
jgi:hypothetical protein